MIFKMFLAILRALGIIGLTQQLRHLRRFSVFTADFEKVPAL